MDWTAIVGHREKIVRLRALIKQNKMPHALLIAGPEGIGKFLVARTAAAALFCSGAEPPCGTCPSCRAFFNGGHPDLVVVEPDGQTIKIEQIRALQAEMALTPYLADRRVIILRDAEKMTLAAANSLLKTLEEPVGNVHFILTAGSRQMLLDTIVSRCRAMDLRALSVGDLTDALRARRVEAREADALASLAGGSFGRAVYLQEHDGLALRAQALDILSACGPGQAAEEIWRRGAALGELEREQLREIILHLNVLLRDLLVLYCGVQDILIYNADLCGDLQALLPKWTESGIFRALAETAKFQKMLTANANQRLAAERFLLKLQEI